MLTQCMKTKTPLTRGKREAEEWRPHGSRLGDLWLRNETEYVTYGMVCRKGG